MRCRGLIALLIWGQSVAAADLGTWGDLWPVKEPDMLTVIMQRLTALEQSGEMGRKMDAFKERVIRNSLRPPAVPGIGRTEKYSSRLFDPSVRLAADIRDNEGRVFARQGEVMNPLQYVPFNQTLYFINGDDPAQVAWMKRQTPPTLESKIILVQGSIPEMQKALDSRIYFDQNGVLCQRLGIDQVDVLFWCAGSQGSMYPFNGWVSNESSPLQSSLLVSERMAFKLHRQGMIMETIGKNNAVCNEYPSPILPKERWRYQMVNMYPDSGQCHPFGRSVMRWETGKNPPNTKKNFGYLMWRKRNCVFL